MIKAENQKKRKPFTAQDTIPYKEIYKDGICRTDDNYYSKMIGYTYDLDGNVVIHVNILKKEENTLKKLNDDVVGEYSSDTINEMLNMGTTYEYIYTGNDGNYTLSDVRLMS